MGPTIRRTIPSTYQPFDRSSVAPCKLPFAPNSPPAATFARTKSIICMGAGLASARGGAAHSQYRLCARITERLPKILKIFTRNTEGTVDGLGALLLDAQVTVPRSVSMLHRGLDNYLHELGLGLINPYMLGQVLAVKKWRPGCSWLSSESKSTTVLPAFSTVPT